MSYYSSLPPAGTPRPASWSCAGGRSPGSRLKRRDAPSRLYESQWLGVATRRLQLRGQLRNWPLVGNPHRHSLFIRALFGGTVSGNHLTRTVRRGKPYFRADALTSQAIMAGAGSASITMACWASSFLSRCSPPPALADHSQDDHAEKQHTEHDHEEDRLAEQHQPNWSD